jgi:L-fucose mutarotase
MNFEEEIFMLLKSIDPLISPELMKTLMEMGHGDDIVFADRNFPSVSKAERLIFYPGVAIEPLLHAVLQYLPLDYTVESPAGMVRIPADSDYKGDILSKYQEIVDTYNGKPVNIEMIDRLDFYKRASKAFCIVATSDSARFANIILRKGIVRIGE